MSNTRMLPIIAGVFAAVFSLSVESREPAATDPFDPVLRAEQVFVGSDRDMPLDGNYRLAIQLARSPSGGIIVPGSILEALDEMRRALPNWFLKVLKESRGDQECSVVVNNIGYNGLVSDWIWVNWVQPGSPIATEFERLGADLRKELPIINALTNGLCELVKTNDERHTLEYVAFLARTPLVQ